MRSLAVLRTNPYNQGTIVQQAQQYMAVKKEFQTHHPANSNHDGMQTPCQPKQNQNKTKNNLNMKNTYKTNINLIKTLVTMKMVKDTTQNT